MNGLTLEQKHSTFPCILCTIRYLQGVRVLDVGLDGWRRRKDALPLSISLQTNVSSLHTSLLGSRIPTQVA
jgi:hypothetical protein